MAVYLISYDIIDGNSDDYNYLRGYLEDMGAERVLESVWLVKSEKSTQAIYQGTKKQFIDVEYRLLVLEITKKIYRHNLRNE